MDVGMLTIDNLSQDLSLLRGLSLHWMVILIFLTSSI